MRIAGKILGAAHEGPIPTILNPGIGSAIGTPAPHAASAGGTPHAVNHIGQPWHGNKAAVEAIGASAPVIGDVVVSSLDFFPSENKGMLFQCVEVFFVIEGRNFLTGDSVRGCGHFLR